MGQAALYVTLSEQEDQQLLKLKERMEAPKRTRTRAEMLRLSHRGWKTDQIAEYVGCRAAMVRRAIHEWKIDGVKGLYDKGRSGRPRKWTEADMVYVEEQLSSEEKTFNTRQIRELLGQERQVYLSRRQISRVLKKKGIAGKEPELVTRRNKTRNSKPSKKQI